MYLNKNMKLLLLIISVASFGYAVSASNVQTITQTIQCDEMNHGKCLKWNNTTQGCFVIDCWKYDDVAGCERAGKPFLPAIILQSIPVTGVFGSGFGNIERWDIFSTYMIAVFCPPVLFCLIACFCYCSCCGNSNEDDKASCYEIFSLAYGCCWSILLLVLYIWGIVVIAGKEVEAPWIASNGTEIMCPMA
jgi:hypothetical protein